MNIAICLSDEESALFSPSDPQQLELQALIEQRRLTPLFQPIVALQDPRILGYEALIRGPRDSALHTPDQLFALARSSRQLAALEFACREVSCRRFVELGLQGKLFLNMSPLSFTDSDYRDGVTREILQRVGLKAERIVFELTERQPLDETELLISATEHFRQQGFAVALDDLGAGYSGLRVWSELHPDYVKIDRHFITDIDQNPVKREFVRAMLDIAHRIGNKVIAEGIETEAELATLINLGVEFGQGFFLARPEAEPLRSIPEALLSLPAVRPRQQDFFRRTLREITVHRDAIAPQMSAEAVVQLFRADVNLSCLPVVAADGVPVGMVSRAELLNIFSRRYSHDLHSNKPIIEFISSRSQILEVDCELKAAGQLLTEDPEQNLSIDIMVCAEGRYLGVATVISLLRCITEEKLRAARHSNPLTELPGNVPLYEWLDHLLLSQQTFVVAYCDINHFKPFNDAFGYSYGDEMIVRLGRLLVQQVDTVLDFVGHVGGDDFIVIFRSPDWYARCEKILAAFSGLHRGLLPEGEYWSQDRSGQRRRFGPLSLAIGCVQPDPALCRTHHQVAQLLADAKHSAKQEGGNHLFVSRRRAPAPVEI